MNQEIIEMRNAMAAFYAEVSDEEFWKAIEEADMGVYSKASIQAFDQQVSDTMASRFWEIV